MKRRAALLAMFWFPVFMIVGLGMIASGDTPPPNTVKAKMYSGDGTQQITATAGALDVNVTGGGGGGTVNQGASGLDPWLVNITNSSLAVTGTFFQATQPVSGSLGRTWVLTSGGDAVSSVQSGSWTVGRNWTLNSGTDSVTISGSVTATNSANGPVGSPPPADATQIAGTDGVNLIALKSSSIGVLSVDASGSSISVSNFPATQPVSQVGPWTVSQGSPPWSMNLSQLNGAAFSATNYIPSRITNGTSYVDPTQIRLLTTADQATVFQGGPWSVTANAGTGTFQTNVTNVSIPVTQSGAWTSGRTWTLSSGTDSVAAAISNFPATTAVTQSTSPWVIAGTATVVQPTGTNLHVVVDSAPTTAVTQSTSPWVVSGTVTANQGTSPWVTSVSNFPATQAVTQSTSPWVVSGTVTANAGTNLNTSLLALDTSVNGILRAQGSTTSGQSGPLIQGAVTTAAPSYTTAQTSPLSLTTAGALRVDNSANTQPVSGTVTANQGGAPWSVSASGNFTVVQPTGTNLHVVVDSAPTTAVTQSTSPWVVSGTVTANQGTSPWVTSVSNFPATQAVTQSTSPWVVSGTVTANAGTNLNTSALALDTSVNGILRAQGSTTSGQSGPLIQGAVTTAAPSYTTAQTSPLSLTTAGALRTDASATTQPVSGTVTANAGTNLNTSALALDATLVKLTIAQSATLGTNTQVLVGGSVTTNQPTYTTGQIMPLSINVRGSTRVKDTGFDSVTLIRNAYSTTNVTTAAYVQLVASTSADINRLQIFDSSGQDLVLAVGGAGSEVNQIQIPPGGWDAAVDIYIPSGSRISVKATSATASSGVLLITALK